MGAALAADTFPSIRILPPNEHVAGEDPAECELGQHSGSVKHGTTRAFMIRDADGLQSDGISVFTISDPRKKIMA